MTVTSVVPYKKYACTGTTEYAYTFRIDDDSDIEVKRIDTAGAETTLTITSEYAVADNGDGTGGTVTTVSTYSDGYLQLRRDMEAVQETEFSDGGPLPSERLEEGLDRVVMLVQQVTSDVDLGALVDAAAASTAAATSAAAALVSENNAADSETAAAASAESFWYPTTGGDSFRTSDTSLSFTALTCRDKDNEIDIDVAQGYRDITVALGSGTGSGAGGLMTGSTVQANHIYLFVAMGDGTDSTIGFLDYTDVANIAARVVTEGYTHYLVIGFLSLNAASEWVGFKNNGSYFTREIASESVISSAVSSTAFSNLDHTSQLAVEYIDLIEYGVRDTSGTGYVIAGDANAFEFCVGTAAGTVNDAHVNVWGNYISQKAGLKPYQYYRTFKASAGTLDLLVMQYKIKGDGRV